MTQNAAAAGAETFVHGTVLSVMFNTNVEKRAGGTYLGTTLHFLNNRGQAESQSWAQQIIDDARNIEIRNALVALQSAPGAAFTLHKTKNDKGYWNVTRIDMGHVEGNRTAPASAPAAAPAAPGASAAPTPVAAAPGFDKSDKMRSKEQCIRGEAVQAAALLAKIGGNGQISIETVFNNAEIIANYITNGLSGAAPAPSEAPVAPAAATPPAPAPATPAAPAAPAAPAPAAVAPAPIPAIPGSVQTPAPAAPPPAPPVAAPAPQVSAAPAAGGFNDGFGA